MNKVASLAYFCLQVLVHFSNKYVLSVLGFRFPLVFLSWQMIVGVILFKLLSLKGIIVVTSLDKPGFVSLFPTFLLFTTSIITASKALSLLPVIYFIAVGNLIPVCILITEKWSQNQNNKKLSYLEFLSCLGIGISSIFIVVFRDGENAENANVEAYSFTNSAYFWLLLHVCCVYLLTLHGRISDVRYNAIDRQWYSHIFALIVLAPAGFYLEEAFEALKFEQLGQMKFLLGSLVCAVSGVVFHLHQSRMRNDTNFGRVHHLGLILTGLLSLAIFVENYEVWYCLVMAVVSLILLLLIPTHINPEEEKLESYIKTEPAAFVEDV